MFQALLTSKKTIFLLNLGTTFDPTLSMDSYISSLCRSSYFHLRNVSLARKYLHEKAIQSLVHAAISTRIDYCNSLLYGIPNKYLKKLQMLQNSAARIVKQIKKTDHIPLSLLNSTGCQLHFGLNTNCCFLLSKYIMTQLLSTCQNFFIRMCHAEISVLLMLFYLKHLIVIL